MGGCAACADLYGYPTSRVVVGVSWEVRFVTTTQNLSDRETK
jgi:hypothetical protein